MQTSDDKTDGGHERNQRKDVFEKVALTGDNAPITGKHNWMTNGTMPKFRNSALFARPPKSSNFLKVPI